MINVEVQVIRVPGDHTRPEKPDFMGLQKEFDALETLVPLLSALVIRFADQLSDDEILLANNRVNDLKRHIQGARSLFNILDDFDKNIADVREDAEASHAYEHIIQALITRLGGKVFIPIQEALATRCDDLKFKKLRRVTNDKDGEFDLALWIPSMVTKEEALGWSLVQQHESDTLSSKKEAQDVVAVP